MAHGSGAVTAPLVVSSLLHVSGSGVPVLWIGAILMALQIPITLITGIAPRRTHHEQHDTPPLNVYRIPMLWIFAVIIALYVGIEAGMGGWTTIFFTRTTDLQRDDAALVTSAFWLALTGGRIAGTILGTRLSGYSVLRGSLAVLSMGGLLLVATVGLTPVSIVAVVLVGFGCGPIFPTMIAIAAVSFPRAAGKATAIIVAAANVGGMTLPFVQGQLLQQISPLASVAQVTAIALAMLVIFGASRVRQTAAIA